MSRLREERSDEESLHTWPDLPTSWEILRSRLRIAQNDTTKPKPPIVFALGSRPYVNTPGQGQAEGA